MSSYEVSYLDNALIKKVVVYNYEIIDGIFWFEILVNNPEMKKGMIRMSNVIVILPRLETPACYGTDDPSYHYAQK